MARNPELEAILQARYDLETCEPGQKTDLRQKLNQLLGAVVAKTGSRSVTPRTIIELTAEAYQEYKRTRRKAERARLTRLR